MSSTERVDPFAQLRRRGLIERGDGVAGPAQGLRRPTRGVPGSPVAIGAYMGSSAAFDDAVTEYAIAYAARNEADFEAHERAIAEGRVVARIGV